jgi:DNA-binding MarR family transcriptional regulator
MREAAPVLKARNRKRMTAKGMFLKPGPVGGQSWARYREAEDRQSFEPQPLATMSDATRASVVKQARGAASPAEPELDELSALVSDVFLIHGWLTQLFMTIKDSVGLTGTEALTLYAVVNSGKPVTVPQIGRSLGHARQVIQREANTLVQRGLLETRENPAHKRAALLVATTAGREVKAGFDAAGRAINEQLAEGLDLQTVLSAREGLRELRRGVERRAREVAPTRSGKRAE